MGKSTSCYPRMSADATGTGVVSHAGAVLLLRTAEKTGLTTALSTALAPWRKPLASHDPGKIVLDLAVTLALGGDCLADIAQLRAHPEVFGRVASDPTVSRLSSAVPVSEPASLRRVAPQTLRSRRHRSTLPQPWVLTQGAVVVDFQTCDLRFQALKTKSAT